MKQKKNSYQTKHVRCIYDVHIEGGQGVLKIVTCLQFLFFLNKRCIDAFLQMEGVGWGGSQIW